MEENMQYKQLTIFLSLLSLLIVSVSAIWLPSATTAAPDNPDASGTSLAAVSEMTGMVASTPALIRVNNFPQQIAEASNNNVLVGNFGGITNGSIVYETDQSGNLVDTKISGSSVQDIKLIPLSPAIHLEKTVGTNPAVCATTDEVVVAPGTAVTYCYEITNTGSVTLTRHNLVDSEVGTILNNFPYSLVPGASAFITQTATILTDTVNSATWTAYNPGPIDVATDTDVATVTMPAPAIELVKTVGTNPAACATTNQLMVQEGTAVTYCYEVTNTGNTNLTVHTLVDSELGTLFNNLAYNLVPGASAFITATATITQNTVNTAIWTAQAGGGLEATAAATARVNTDYMLYLPVIIKETAGTAMQPED